MDEFGSPLTGGIRAVRRNISSSFFGAPQNSQPDSITTELLQEQSLKLSLVSGQLQNISRQVAVLDFNLKSVRENIALGDQLERQREAEKLKRERILAEQGLREGKESALEQKIQSALVFPLQRIGLKTQNILGQLGKYLLTLAGGWLTLNGFDLLQSMAEGNIDKINKLKTKFLTGLTVILGSLTAISIGMKKTLAILSVFGGNVARMAFGGLFRSSLFGVKLLLAGLVRKAAGLGNLTGGGGLLEALAELAANIVIIRIFGGGGGKVKNLIKGGKGFTQIKPDSFTRGGIKPTPITTGTGANKQIKKIKKVFSKPQVTGDVPQIQKTPQPQAQPLNKLGNNVGNDVGAKLRRSYPKGFKYKINNPSFLERARSGAVGLFNRGKNLVDDGIKTITSPAGKVLTKIGTKTGSKGVLKSVSKKIPLAGAVAGLVFGIERAMAGDDLGASLEILSGLLGATGFGIKGSIGIDAFLIGRDLSKAGEKTDDMSEETYKIPEDGVGDLIPVNPIKTDDERINKISNFTEDNIEVIMSNTNDGGQGSASLPMAEPTETYLPDISFDKQNPHALSTSAILGIGD